MGRSVSYPTGAIVTFDMTKVGTFSNGGGIYAAKDVEHIPADNLGDKPGHVVINGLLTDG